MKIDLLKYESYLKMIKNSAGSKMFRNLYLEINGKKIDATQNGKYSCAFFVSNVLLIWGLISEGHASVLSTIKDMEGNGWKKIPKSKIRPGDVIVWDKEKSSDNSYFYSKEHYHNGFYIGAKKAISNSSNGKGVPIIHNWNYNNKRKIIAVYRYPKF
ncbi:MAG: peptidoglycan amidohydrolase family protein [bacterium]|nr:peptidoglycan amidohydrolase family protein [bacterium]